MSRYQPGDIVEIRLEQGLAYAQLTHEHESYPPVVRLFRGLSDSRPSDLEAHVAQAPRLTAMIPLEQALDRLGLAHEKAGSAALPEDERKFPTFRMPIRDKQGEIVYWWFWDGESLSYASDLDEPRNLQEHLGIKSSNRQSQLGPPGPGREWYVD